ncbi:hypothetical protein RRG08_019981 [Elysia crispata]|uniref:Uncharacterized protein n=1 Tax=Elysia crispata TaxID=231223 RepID=A0AAE1BB53_9GAST|nr:hypothetical protein RRG08_019981 [Elysia crispata]
MTPSANPVRWSSLCGAQAFLIISISHHFNILWAAQCRIPVRLRSPGNHFKEDKNGTILYRTKINVGILEALLGLSQPGTCLRRSEQEMSADSNVTPGQSAARFVYVTCARKWRAPSQVTAPRELTLPSSKSEVITKIASDTESNIKVIVEKLEIILSFPEVVSLPGRDQSARLTQAAASLGPLRMTIVGLSKDSSSKDKLSHSLALSGVYCACEWPSLAIETERDMPSTETGSLKDRLVFYQFVALQKEVRKN